MWVPVLNICTDWVCVCVKHETLSGYQCICMCMCVFFKFTMCVYVHTNKRSGAETRRLYESLNRMSGMHKNITKEPETASCRMLLLCTVTLDVLNRAFYLWGRATSNKSDKSAESQGAIIFNLCLTLKVSPKLFCPIRETQEKKAGLKPRLIWRCRKVQSGFYMCFKWVCKWFPAQIISVCLHKCRYVCPHSCVHMHISAYECLCINLLLNPTVCHHID